MSSKNECKWGLLECPSPKTITVTQPLQLTCCNKLGQQHRHLAPRTWFPHQPYLFPTSLGVHILSSTSILFSSPSALYSTPTMWWRFSNHIYTRWACVLSRAHIGLFKRELKENVLFHMDQWVGEHAFGTTRGHLFCNVKVTLGDKDGVEEAVREGRWDLSLSKFLFLCK